MDPYLDNLQRDRRSLPRPSGVVMFGIYPGHRSHQVKILKKAAAVSKKKPSDAVAIISYDDKPGIQAIATTAPDLPPKPGVHAAFAREPIDRGQRTGGGAHCPRAWHSRAPRLGAELPQGSGRKLGRTRARRTGTKSPKIGVSGSASERVAVVTASAPSVPALMYSIAPGMDLNITCTCPRIPTLALGSSAVPCAVQTVYPAHCGVNVVSIAIS